MINDMLMFACRMTAILFSGWAMLMLAEVAKNGAVQTSVGVWSLTQSLVVPAVLIALGFLLAFGGARP